VPNRPDIWKTFAEDDARPPWDVKEDSRYHTAYKIRPFVNSQLSHQACHDPSSPTDTNHDIVGERAERRKLEEPIRNEPPIPSGQEVEEAGIQHLIAATLPLPSPAASSTYDEQEYWESVGKWQSAAGHDSRLEPSCEYPMHARKSLLRGISPRRHLPKQSLTRNGSVVLGEPLEFGNGEC
jgi:hypothetical protein